MSKPATRVLLAALVPWLCFGLGPWGAACGSHVAGSSDAGDASDAPPSADGVMCTGTVGTFPTFDKTCAGVGDCAIGIHQTNCCGATMAIGIARGEQDRFTADEKVCVAQYPQCACPALPTVAEDGRNPIAGQDIVVECQSSKCMTTVR